MKQLISIFLLASFCILLFGYHLLYCFQIAVVKDEMKAFLKIHQNHKDVLVLSFTNRESKELEWENGQEFRYQNEMYDVIDKSTKGGQLRVQCISDKKETMLVNEYQKTNKRNQSNAFAVQLITAYFVLPSGIAISHPQNTLEHYFSHCSCKVHDQVSTVFIPPPDVV